MTSPLCTGRIVDEDGEDRGECGDEGHVCDACAEVTHAYYRKLYGHMSRDQLMACDPRPMTEERKEAFNQELRDAGRGHLVRP